LSKLEQMIAHINALFALGNAQAAHERIDSLGNQIMGSILQDVKSGPVRLIAPRELRSLPWEALHVRGSERLADNRAVLHANGAGSSQAFRSMEVGPCYAVGLAENGFLRRGWQQATSSEDLSGLENPLAVWFSHSFHMCTDDALGSFFAHEGPSSIGRRVGATCLANLGNNGSPIVAITRVAGTPWAKGEPEDLTGLAILGGAQALLRVRWSLSPAESEMLEFFLAERLREPEVGPLALARLIGENERLRPIRPAIEISGPLVRTRRNARLSLVN
jgi:hypothetical protein